MERETTRYLGLSSLYARAREEGHFKWSAFVGGGAKGTCFDYIYIHCIAYVYAAVVLGWKPG